LLFGRHGVRLQNPGRRRQFRHGLDDTDLTANCIGELPKRRIIVRPIQEHIPPNNPAVAPDPLRRLPMKALFVAALMSLSLGFGAIHAQASYHAPAHNFYQNNWMGGGD
jgi:hypothetical protein